MKNTKKQGRPGLTLTEAEQILKQQFPAADADDLETYLYGSDDPEAYFSKIADAAELADDFRTFVEGN